jgi:rubrerythrin
MNDSISRKGASAWLYNMGYEKLSEYVLDDKRFPSIDRPQGKWIFKTVFPNDKSEFPMGYLVCSVCGSHHSNSTPCKYCDNCGARMK